MQKLAQMIEADAFPRDWYGWITNQASHIALGVFAVFFISVAAFMIDGQFPYRDAVFLWCLAAYVSFEIITQGWHGFDTVEDTVFVVGYGVGAPLAAFQEIQAGQSGVALDVMALLPFFIVATVHLAFGVIYRIQSR